jgi:hypothetical protein
MLSQTETILKRDDRFLQAAYDDFLTMYNEETDCKEYHEMLQQLQYSMDKLNKTWNNFISICDEQNNDNSNENLVKPDRYKGKDGKDLLQLFEESLLSDEEYKGFLKGNVYKYLKRYEHKNGREDLEKATVYLNKLYDFEVRHEKEKQVH